MGENHTQDSILELTRGFMASRVLISAAELDLFTLLTPKPLTADALAETIGADLRGITILLDALSALGFLVKTNGTYQTEPSVAPLLSSDTPTSTLPMILHMGSVWQNWSNITEIVRGKTVPELKIRRKRSLVPQDPPRSGCWRPHRHSRSRHASGSHPTAGGGSVCGEHTGRHHRRRHLYVRRDQGGSYGSGILESQADPEQGHVFYC